MRAGPTLFCLALMVIAGPAAATADGPDHYQVKGVPRNSFLNLRTEPSTAAPRIARIPAYGRCLRNLGCRGGLTFEEYMTLTHAERKRRSEANPRWCKIEFEGKVGWVAGQYLAEGHCAAARATPTP